MKFDIQHKLAHLSQSRRACILRDTQRKRYTRGGRGAGRKGNCLWWLMILVTFLFISLGRKLKAEKACDQSVVIIKRRDECQNQSNASSLGGKTRQSCCLKAGKQLKDGLGRKTLLLILTCYITASGRSSNTSPWAMAIRYLNDFWTLSIWADADIALFSLSIAIAILYKCWYSLEESSVRHTWMEWLAVTWMITSGRR